MIWGNYQMIGSSDQWLTQEQFAALEKEYGYEAYLVHTNICPLG